MPRCQYQAFGNYLCSPRSSNTINAVNLPKSMQIRCCNISMDTSVPIQNLWVTTCTRPKCSNTINLPKIMQIGHWASSCRELFHHFLLLLRTPIPRRHLTGIKKLKVGSETLQWLSISYYQLNSNGKLPNFVYSQHKFALSYSSIGFILQDEERW